jgi:hypothetical protein
MRKIGRKRKEIRWRVGEDGAARRKGGEERRGGRQIN